MNENTKPNAEEVILAFAVEPIHDRKTLERYLSEYPEYSEVLVDCAIELTLDIDRRKSVTDSKEENVENAWQRFQVAMKVGNDVPVNPFAKISPTIFKSLAKRLDISNLLLIRLRDRAIEPITIPRRFIEKIAAEMRVTSDTVSDFLNSTPSLTLNNSLRTSSETKGTTQISFQEAIETSQLTESQKNLLKNMVDK
jgi:hypothetical protein